MRRRDYELIAQGLKAAKPVEPSARNNEETWTAHWNHVEAWRHAVVTVGEHLQADSPAFDQELFAINCGVN